MDSSFRVSHFSLTMVKSFKNGLMFQISPQSPSFLLFAILFIFGTSFGSSYDALISCVCTTGHCQSQNTNRCSTSSMCYTQYLDRKDGSDPLTKGCITTRTSLLCENRRPAVAGLNWPMLVCCSSNLCNEDTIPTVPTWTLATNRSIKGSSSFTTRKPQLLPSSSLLPPPLPGISSSSKEGNTFDFTRSNQTKPRVVLQSTTTSAIPVSPGHHPHPSQPSISTFSMVVLVAGITSLVIIGIGAFIILRKYDRIYKHNGDYISSHFKGQNVVTNCTKSSEEDSELALPLPIAVNSM